mgnify:CR=1 FL=1
MSRETLKDFLSSRGDLSDSISYILKEAPDGIGLDPGTGEELLDLTDSMKGLIGDYVNFITSKENEYHIEQGNKAAASSNKGDALVNADSQGSNKVFIEKGTQLSQNLSSRSNSGKFDTSGTSLDTLIDKVGGNFSNNEKLKDIQGQTLNSHGTTQANPQGEANDIIQATHKMFLKNNRFANVGDPDNNTFTEVPQDISEFEAGEAGRGSINVQNKFGVYNKNENIVSIDDLKEIGSSLIRRAVEFSHIDNNGFVKQDVGNLSAKEADGFPRDESGPIRANRGYFLERDPEAINFKTFGSTYYDKFKFNNVKIHRTKAAISLLAVKTLGKLFFSEIMLMFREQDQVELAIAGEKHVEEKSGVDPVIYMAGKSKESTSLILDNFIFGKILTNTTYPISNAIDEGLRVVLGADDSVSEIQKNDKVNQSPGFWLAVSNSVLKTFDDTIEKYNIDGLSEIESTEELFMIYKDMFSSNSFMKFFNVMAVIGDISLKSSGGVVDPDENYKHPWDVDAIPDNRATPGKSRKSFGLNQNELAWNQDASPSMYMLPANIIRAASKLNNTVYGTNPVRGMFGSKLAKNTYMGLDVDGSYNRIPSEVVKIVEDKLEAEYVPFYFQDLRTNEVISFNAFLSTLEDSYTSDYNEVDGYGRLDPVQMYRGTKRSISLSFTLAATNKEDFDSMWYKINKLLTLIYPQWTPGTLVSNNANTKSKFYQPFSQVIGASPIVRLRVGDVIKSNYSRFGLARLFGIGDANVNPSTGEDSFFSSTAISDARDTLTDITIKLWLAVYGSPHSLINAAFNTLNTPSSIIGRVAAKAGKNVAINMVSSFLVNGFANPLAVGEIISQLRDPNLDKENLLFAGDRNFSQLKREIQENSLFDFSKHNGIVGGYHIGDSMRKVLLKPNVINGYYCLEDGKKYMLTRRLEVRTIDKGIGFKGAGDRIAYKVQVVDYTASRDLFKKHLIVNHADILPDPKQLFLSSVLGASLFVADPTALLDLGLEQLVNDHALAAGIPNDAIDFVRFLYENEESTFMRPVVNPFTRAIETTMGRGLAGVIKGFTFDWLDDTFPWEVDHNSRAPTGCKISFSFSVIHDLPPGLDHTGYNRAPLYNVGDIMKNVAGDVYQDGGRQGEFNFKEQGRYSSRVK